MAGVSAPAIVARSVLTAGLRGRPGSPAVSFPKLSGGLGRRRLGSPARAKCRTGGVTSAGRFELAFLRSAVVDGWSSESASLSVFFVTRRELRLGVQ